jgi:peptidoglycan/xylan/chitin deacetylase (PgdA/CDA1 family)
MIRVAIRFDDPSRNSNRQVEHGLIAALRQQKLPATFAVIPYSPQDNQFVPLTVDAVPHLISAADDEVIEIALHGYRHQRHESADKSIKSEFVGRTIDEQMEMIHAGLSQLEQVFGRRLSGFVPPFLSFDQNTVLCLEKMGFSYLSAGWNVHRSDCVAILPRTCNVFDIVKNVHALRMSKLDGVIIGVLHHYDFKEDGGSEATRTLADFSTLLAWIKEQSDIEVASLASLANDTSINKWRNAHNFHQLAQKLPWRLRQRLPDGCLITSPPWRVAIAALLG